MAISIATPLVENTVFVPDDFVGMRRGYGGGSRRVTGSRRGGYSKGSSRGGHGKGSGQGGHIVGSISGGNNGYSINKGYPGFPGRAAYGGGW